VTYGKSWNAIGADPCELVLPGKAPQKRAWIDDEECRSNLRKGDRAKTQSLRTQHKAVTSAQVL